MDQARTLEVAFSIISVLLLFLTSMFGWIVNQKLSDIKRKFEDIDLSLKAHDAAYNKNTLLIATIPSTSGRSKSEKSKSKRSY